MSKRQEIADPTVHRGMYKIEIHFGSNRTTQEAKGLMICWEHGAALNGDGDIQMLFCGYDECARPFKVANARGSLAMCPFCERKMWRSQYDKTNFWKDAPQAKHLPFAYTIKGWPRKPTRWIANLLVKYFRLLDSDADIYLKYHPSDIRIEAHKGRPDYDKVRNMRGLHVYPVHRILADTAHGADLGKRFLAFIRA